MGSQFHVCAQPRSGSRGCGNRFRPKEKSLTTKERVGRGLDRRGGRGRPVQDLLAELADRERLSCPLQRVRGKADVRKGESELSFRLLKVAWPPVG